MKRNLPGSLGYFLVIGVIAILTLVTPACLSMSAYIPPSGVTLSSIKVSMASNSSLTNALRVFFDMFNPSIKEYTDYPAAMGIGSKEQFVAVGTYSDTAYSAITSQVSWSSSNTTVATISAGGLVSAVANGTANITATLSGITSPSLMLTVGSPNSNPSSDLSNANIAPADEEKSINEIKRSYSNHHEFIRRYFHAEPESPLDYHIVLNTDHMSIQEAASVIVHAVNLRKNSKSENNVL